MTSDSLRLLFFLAPLREMYSCHCRVYGTENPYGMVYSKREVEALFSDFKILDYRVENFVGEEALPRFGGRIPRNVWLATLGKVAGLDLYFSARAIK